MAATPARDAKLVQLLNEAYTKERQLEVALSAHVQMTTRDDYAKRLKDHLKETKSHASQVSKRIKQLGGTPETVSLPGPEGLTKAAEAVSGALGKAKAAAQGPLHAMRGSGEQERMLQNARTEYQEEAWEIATYTIIDAVAVAAGDKPTAKLARDILRQEERMQQFLGTLLPSCPRTSPTTRSPWRRSTDPGRAGGQRTRSRRAPPAVPRMRPPARRPRPAAAEPRVQARQRRPEDLAPTRLS
jgi:ferritin-like metal-binding protein YciE